MPTDSLLPEADFAETLNLPRETVRAARQRALREPEHFIHGEGGRIMLTPAGCDLLLRETTTPETPVEKKTPPAPQVLIIVSQVQNPRQVLARLPDAEKNDPPLVLIVPTTREHGRELNFFTQPGMRVLARHRAGATWDFAGRRPRFRGDPLMRAPEPAPAPASAATGTQQQEKAQA